MPYPKTETARLAEQYGITYACAKYRLANGIPLDAPVMPNGNAKAWATRRTDDLARERQQRMVWQAREKARREAREARERERKARVAARVAARLEAEMKRQEEPFTTIKAAPRQAWQNPFAALAGKRSVTTASQTASTTSSNWATAASSRGESSHTNSGRTV